MTTLINRYCRLTVGGIPFEGGNILSPLDGSVITGLTISFSIEKSVKPSFNSGDFKIHNLSRNTRDEVSGLKDFGISFEAGYANGLGRIFTGKATTIDHYREGDDWVTHIQALDHDRSGTRPYVDSFKPGTEISTIFKKLIKAAGIKPGNALDIIKDAKFQSFVNGYSASGTAYDQINDLLLSMGLTWSIQDGEMQVLKGYKPIAGASAPVISAKSGLLDSPRLTKVQYIFNFLSFKSLLNPSIVCGHPVKIISDRYPQGITENIFKLTHSGSTTDGDWTTDGQIFLSMGENVSM